MMPANAATAEDRLAELGIHLAEAPTPFGADVPAVQTGNLRLQSARWKFDELSQGKTTCSLQG
jgi:hypothetical protein